MKKMQVLTGLLLFLLVGEANAQKECQADLDRLCSAKDLKDQLQCLKENSHALSSQCKDEIQRLVQAGKQAFARGGGAMSSFGGMNFLTPPIPLLSYEGRVVPGGNSPRLTENRLSFSSPVVMSKLDLLSLSLSGANLHFSDPILLNTGALVPTDLYRAELGAQYSHQFGKGKSWGLRSSLGYASDHPFQSGRDLTVSGALSYTFPASPRSFWSLSLFYSNNTAVLNGIPVPGFMYIYQGDQVRVVAGFPMVSVQWTPKDPWSFSASVFGVNVSAEAAYGSVDEAQFFAGFQWVRQVFMLKDRTNEKDRLRIEEKKVQFGVRTPLFWSIGSEFAAGRSFNRDVSIGENLGDKSGGNALLDSSYYLSWNLRVVI